MLKESSEEVKLPRFLKVEEGISYNLKLILEEYSIPTDNLILVTTEHLYSKYKDRLNIFSEKIFISHSSISHVNEILQSLKTLKNCVLIGFGGGKVIDVTKYLAIKLGLKYISIPTTLSNDGIYSPVAVLEDERKRKVRTGTDIPIGIIVDLSIVKEAPLSTLQAGVGDIISNISALEDWKRANKEKKEKINDFAYTLSKMSVEYVLNYSNADLRDISFLRRLAYGLVMSGLSMEIAGSSRPCSGGEHDISHSIDYLYPEKSKPHGIQVAFGTLVTELLRGNDINNIIKIFQRFSLPRSLEEFGFDKEEMINAVKYAKNMRDRHTILKVVDDEKIHKSVSLLSKGSL